MQNRVGATHLSSFTNFNVGILLQYVYIEWDSVPVDAHY